MKKIPVFMCSSYKIYLLIFYLVLAGLMSSCGQSAPDETNIIVSKSESVPKSTTMPSTTVATQTKIPASLEPTPTIDLFIQESLPTVMKLCNEPLHNLSERKWAQYAQSSAVAFINVEYETEGWFLSEILEKPKSTEDVRTLACIKQSRTQQGVYIGTASGTGYQPAWDIVLLSWPDGELIGGRSFLGGMPPETITESGLYYGNLPIEETSIWLEDVLSEPFLILPKSVIGMEFLDDEGQLVVAMRGGEVRIHDIESREEIGKIEFSGEYVNKIALSPNSSIVAASVCLQAEDDTCLEWEVQVQEVLSGKLLYTFKDNSSIVRSLVFSPDGSHLATGSSHEVERTTRAEVFLWDLSNGRSAQIISGESGHIYGMLFSPDGVHLITDINRSIEIWDIQTRKKINTIPFEADWFDFEISPDGSLLAISYCAEYENIYCKNSKISLWDFEDGKEVELGSGDLDIYTMAFSPDSSKLAVSSCVEYWKIDNQDQPPQFICSAGQIVLWDVATSLQKSVAAHTLAVPTGLDFSSDGSILATGGYDGIIKLWPVH